MSMKQIWCINDLHFRKIVLWYKKERDVESFVMKMYNAGKCEDRLTLTKLELNNIPFQVILANGGGFVHRISNGRRHFEIVISGKEKVFVTLSILKFSNLQWREKVLQLTKEEFIYLEQFMANINSDQLPACTPKSKVSFRSESLPDLLDETVLDPSDIA